jgi:hypothetical protein
MTLAWLLLNTMSPAMANSATMQNMQTMDQNGSTENIEQTSESTHPEHAQSADLSTASGDPMKECVSFSCCLTTREDSVLAQAWQYFSTLNFDKSSQAFFVEYKPGSKDRPPKHL